MDYTTKVDVDGVPVASTIALSQPTPFLINVQSGKSAKIEPQIKKFLKLLIACYPGYATKRQIFDLLDPMITWKNPRQIASIVNRLRLNFKEVGVEKSVATFRGEGCQLLVPVQIVDWNIAPVVIPISDVPLLKHLFNTHPDATTTQWFAQKLGIRL